MTLQSITFLDHVVVPCFPSVLDMAAGLCFHFALFKQFNPKVLDEIEEAKTEKQREKKERMKKKKEQRIEE